MKQPELGPETIHMLYRPVPDDPYDIDVLAFRELQRRGYPVSLQSIDWNTAANELEAKNPHGSTHVDARLDYYAQWMRGAAHNPAFEYVAPGKSDNVDDEQLYRQLDQDFIDDHPASVLVSAVSAGNPFDVEVYRRMIDEDGLEPFTHRPVDVKRVFLAGCYVAAWERFVTRGVGQDERLLLALLPAHDVRAGARQHAAIYQALKRRKVPPISSEALGSLVQDYYDVVETAVPAIAAMKNLPAVPAEDASFS